MSSIDDRVVQMKFDNAQFQKGVSDTNKSLDDLKKGLNLDASAKSLDNLNSAGSRFSLANIATGVQDIASKFSALSIIGIAALASIASKAVETGTALLSALTVDPIKAGLQEYETNLNSIQTILSNTQVSGATLDDVNGALQELNTYSDKTIYNFSEMAKNIGTFTAAGVDLKTSTEAIKGIANLAAMSGSNSQQASTAMYQLSQAISAGKVGLQDWNSVVNAGMGGTTFQRALATTAVKMGKLSSGSIQLTGDMKNVSIAGDSFRESITAKPGQDSWLTSDVLTTTLKQFTGDLSDAQVKAMGFNDEETAAIQQMAQTAMHAATEVKTLSGVFDVGAETAGSGWAQTWQLIFGDFGEAKTLFTNMSNGLNALINESSNARNNVLKDWKALGGRNIALDALKNIFDTVLAVAKTIGQAFKEIFPPVTGQTLLDLTNKFKAFTESLKPSATTLENLKRTFKGVFAIFDIGFIIVSKIWGVLERLFKTMDGAGANVLGVTASWGDFLVKLRDTLRDSEKLNAFFIGLGNFLVDIVNKVKDFGQKFQEVFGHILDKLKTIKIDTSGFTTAFDNLRDSLGKLKPTGEMISKIWDGLINIFKKGLEIGRAMAEKLGEAFKGIGGGMADATKGIDFNTILGILGTGLIGGIFVMVKKLIKQIKGAIEDFGSGDGLLDTIKTAFGGLTDTLSQMQSTLKASTLLLIAGAIALLTLSVVELSKIDASKLPAVLAAMTVMFVQLSTALAILDKINIMGSAKNMAIIGGAMILLAIAIKILASAMGDIAKLDWQGVLKGLVGVTGMLIGLSVAAKIMSGQNGNMIATGIGLIAVAVGVKILASACADFAKLSWDEIARGLTGVGTVLGALAIFTRISQVNKGAIGQAAGLILLGVALKIMASAVKDFGDLDPKKIEQGLGVLMAVLGALAIFTRVANPGGMIGVAVAMVILGAALKIIGQSIETFGNFSWDVIGKGLATLAGALVAIAIAMRIMPPNMLITATSLVIVGAALKIIGDALNGMGKMSWEEIGKGFTVLASSLMTIAIAMDFMTGALPGAAALLIVAAALTIFVPVLQTLGTMPWQVIGQGFAVLVIAFVLLGAAGLILGPVVPILMGLGIAIGLLGLGAALAGAGMLAFATGLTALSIAGAAGTTVLVGIVAGLLGLIPYAFQMIGEGIVAFAKVLSDNVPTFVAAAVKLMLGILDGLKQVIPAIVDTLLGLILMLLQKLVEYVPQFVDAGFKILIGFLQGIANNIGQVVTVATDIIVNFLNGIANNIGRIIDAGVNVVVKFLEGIGNNVGRITNAGADLVIKTINSVASTIETRSGELRAAGGRLADAIIDGMTGGLWSKAKNVAQSAWDLGKQAIDSIANAIDSHSPSKETHKLGQYAGQGFANGMDAMGTTVEKASGDLGKTALDVMKEKVSGIWETMSDHTDFNPTITPVLDLSSIQKDSGLISGMLSSANLAVDSSYNKATVLSAADRANREAALTNSDGTPVSSTSVTYNQTITSPKAISQAEIYRDTKNQLSKIKKGELVK